ATNSLSGVFPIVGPAFTIDKTRPTATVTRAGAALTNAGSVAWTVAFSEPVAVLSAGNFTLQPSGGVSGAVVSTITGGPTLYTVNVSTGTGDGTLGLTL